MRTFAGFCGKPCLVNDQVQACPGPPDGCCFSLYCLSCSFDWGGHEFSNDWFGGPTVEYRVNACTGPNPTKARIRGKWYGASHEGRFSTPWYEIAVGNPIVADFTCRPTDPLGAGDPIMFVNASCGGTDFHWDSGDGESADGEARTTPLRGPAATSSTAPCSPPGAGRAGPGLCTRSRGTSSRG